MRTLIALMAVAALMTAPANAFYVAGSFNGWDAAGDMMTPIGVGLWSVDLTLGASERHEFKVTTGDWSDAWPYSGNSWFVTGDDGAVTITYDTNVYDDGWVNTTRRIGVLGVPSVSWTAVGDWQGWSNDNPATAMTSMGGGVHFYEQALAPGTWWYKAVKTGSWDAIGADGRSINADNLSFETTEGNPIARFYVNELEGTIKVDVVPEPISIITLGSGLAGLAALIRRRR